MRVTPITRLRQSLWNVLRSVYQSDIGSYHVLHERHLYFGRNVDQTLSNPKKRTSKRGILFSKNVQDRKMGRSPTFDLTQDPRLLNWSRSAIVKSAQPIRALTPLTEGHGFSLNAVRHKDSGKAEWGERDVVPLSPAVRKANRLHKGTEGINPTFLMLLRIIEQRHIFMSVKN